MNLAIDGLSYFTKAIDDIKSRADKSAESKKIPVVHVDEDGNVDVTDENEPDYGN